MNHKEYNSSKYIVTTKNCDRKIFLNLLNGVVFSTTLKEAEFIKEQLNNLTGFKSDYPAFFSKLFKMGFIIDKNVNELDLIKFRNRNEVFLNRHYRLFLNPTLECNFNCHYCVQNHAPGKMSNQTKARVMKHIQMIVEKRLVDGINLSWFGGEPLLYFDEIVYPISKFTKDLFISHNLPYKSSITTNGFFMDETRIKSFNDIGLNSFQITLDGDRDLHDQIRNSNGAPSFDTIINNINSIGKHVDNFNIVLRINYTGETLEKVKSIFALINHNYRCKILIDFQRIWQTYDTIKGNSTNQLLLELNEYCSSLGYKIRRLLVYIGRNHTCYVDRYHHLEINYDGLVYKCTARGYDKEYSIGSLSEDGSIDYDSPRFSTRFSKATFENEMCIKCKYLPICTGPCSQKILEINDDVEELKKNCYLRNTEISIDDFIIGYYNDFKNAKTYLSNKTNVHSS
jgi:uncharacterized protein